MPALLPRTPSVGPIRERPPLCARCGHLEVRHYVTAAKAGGGAGCTALVTDRQPCPCTGWRPPEVGPQGPGAGSLEGPR